MLEVVELEEARLLVTGRFPVLDAGFETVPLDRALGRAVARDVIAVEGETSLISSLVFVKLHHDILYSHLELWNLDIL